jgi:hypothetical protein
LLRSTAIGTIKKDIDVTIPDGNDRRDSVRGDAVEIELGAIGGDLRYWRAKEGMRQGEERLEAQSAVRTALEARATALTGWAAVALLAAASVAFSGTDVARQIGAAVAGLVLLWAAIEGIHAVRPRNWAMRGYDPSVVISDPLESELEALESLAGGITSGIQANHHRLNAMGRSLRRTGKLLISAPLAGAAAYLLAYERAPIMADLAAAAHQLSR